MDMHDHHKGHHKGHHGASGNSQDMADQVNVITTGNPPNQNTDYAYDYYDDYYDDYNYDYDYGGANNGGHHEPAHNPGASPNADPTQNIHGSHVNHHGNAGHHGGGGHHAGGGHRGGGGHHGSGHHGGMQMVFSVQTSVPLLFEWWPTDTVTGLTLALVATFALSVIYEGLISFICYLHDTCEKRTNLQRFLHALAHMLRVTMGYSLMLCAMTYNIWILVAMVMGAGLGHLFVRPIVLHYLSRRRKHHIEEEEEANHNAESFLPHGGATILKVKDKHDCCANGSTGGNEKCTSVPLMASIDDSVI